MVEPHYESLSGSTALVTGAAGDIGRTVARHIADAGADLVLADHHDAAAQLAELVDELTTAHPAASVAGRTFDVTDAARVDDVVDGVVDDVGPIDVLVNNAGYQGLFTTVDAYDPRDFARVMDVNVNGVFHVLRAVSSRLVASGSPGAVVNVASMAGVSGAPNMPAYSASKAAVIGLTKGAAKDLAPHAIRVNAVSPAFIGPGTMWDRQVAMQAAAPSPYFADTVDEVERQMLGQIPLGRYGSLDEVAKVVTMLVSDTASYLTGVNIEIAGGAS